MKQPLVFVLVFALIGSTHAVARTFITWAPWQTDSVLVAWAIKRFIEKDADFDAAATGTAIAADIALDSPTSKYRRNGRRTAFEEVVRIHNIESKCVESLRPINRVLELTAWRKSEFPDAEAFELGLSPLVPKGAAKGGLDRAFAYIDEFCAKRGGM